MSLKVELYPGHNWKIVMALNIFMCLCVRSTCTLVASVAVWFVLAIIVTRADNTCGIQHSGAPVLSAVVVHVCMQHQGPHHLLEEYRWPCKTDKSKHTRMWKGEWLDTRARTEIYFEIFAVEEDYGIFCMFYSMSLNKHLEAFKIFILQP